MSKTTAASAEKTLDSRLHGYKESAAAVKAAHRTARQAFLDDPLTSDLGKQENLAALDQRTRAALDGIRADQDSFVKGLRDQLDKEFRGSQPSDANSVLLRRDAADRARNITENDEALAMLKDAIRNGDDSMAHAIGSRARDTGMEAVSEAYRESYSTTAESAAALAVVEQVTSGPAYNLANQMTYAAPNV